MQVRRLAVRCAMGAGVLAATAASAQECPGDCDGNGVLNILDFVCFQQDWQAGCQKVEIDDVFPTKGPPGTVVTVKGKNLDAFGDDPDDVCFVAGELGFQVLKVLPDQIQAALLPHDDEAKGGEIFLAFGDGEQVIFDFPAEEGEVVEPLWCWGQPPDGPIAAAGFIFEPVPGVLPTDVFPSVLIDGDLVIDLDGADWEEGDKIRIIARAWCELRHIDCVLPTFRLTSDATPNQCALAICSLITQAFAQLGVTVDCFVGPGPTVTISYPDCDIEPGISLTSAVERTACADMGEVDVGNVEPMGGAEGDIIMVEVKGLTSPVETCIQVIGGCPLKPMMLVGTTLIAEVGPVPPGAQPGPLLVARGIGTLLDPDDVFVPGLEATEIGDGFQGIAGFGNDFIFDGPFEPGGESPDTTAFKFSDGQIVAELTDDWETGDKIRIDVHFNALVNQEILTHFDCFSEEICLTAPNPDVNSCATLLCALIQQCFAAQNPPVDIQCNTIGGTIIITAPGIGPIVSGGGTIKRN